jgi:uncharacterized repeat protein (TIGR04138 family)
MLDPEHPIAELLRRDDRYHFDAYVFVFEALRYAQDKLGMGRDLDSGDLDAKFLVDEPSEEGDGPAEHHEAERHITGQELCEAMRLFAHEQFGYLAKNVLNHWGIASTGDFGDIVFNLIEIEQMRKTSRDRREDFEDVFDFDEGFQHNFQFTVPDSSEEPRQ